MKTYEAVLTHGSIVPRATLGEALRDLLQYSGNEYEGRAAGILVRDLYKDNSGERCTLNKVEFVPLKDIPSMVKE